MDTASPDAGDSPVPGDIITLTPHDIGVSGGGVARFSGMTVFLDKGLPGDTLLCRVTERKPRFLKAAVLETLAPSPDAVPAFCPYGGQCGGCAWTNLAYSAQTAWKERHVRETLRRVGKVVFQDKDNAGAVYLPIIPSPRVTGYRNKMEFAFGLEDGVPALGLRQRGAHAVVSVKECPLCAFPVETILAVTRRWMREDKHAVWNGGNGFLRFLVVRCPDYSPDGAPRCLVECITAPGTADAARSVARLGDILIREAGATGFTHSVRAAGTNVAYGERTVYGVGETTVTEKVGDVVLQAPVRAFMQANTAASALLYDQVRLFARQENGAQTIWDAYSGVGGIAIFLAGNGTRVLGIDSVPEAVDFAKKNAGINGVADTVSFLRKDAAAFLKAAKTTPDLVVADPPRAGMARDFTEALLRLKPAGIIAVSCDPGSLARDLAILQAGYAVRHARAVDLFPHTPHVETVCLLTRMR